MSIKNSQHYMKVLILRFSSFGDIVASLSLATAIKEKYPTSEIHWVTREDFAEIIQNSKQVSKVWPLKRKKGGWELLHLAKELKKENYTHVYDAHNNTRSRLISLFLVGPFQFFSFFNKIIFIRKSQFRWRRFLLFNFHLSLYPKPFTLQFALLEPLIRWGISSVPPEAPVLQIPKIISEKIKPLMEIQLTHSMDRPFRIALSPSASYALKRWPKEHWIQLIEHFPEVHFYLLGGPEDHFFMEISSPFKGRVLNFAGQLSYLESAAVIDECDLLVSNDTGLMHVAEQLDKPCIALMGPAPFGFPVRNKTKILELELDCRPCSKHGQGPCTNSVFQKCLVDISPETVSQEVQKIFKDLNSVNRHLSKSLGELKS